MKSLLKYYKILIINKIRYYKVSKLFKSNLSLKNRLNHNNELFKVSLAIKFLKHHITETSYFSSYDKYLDNSLSSYYSNLKYRPEYWSHNNYYPTTSDVLEYLIDIYVSFNYNFDLVLFFSMKLNTDYNDIMTYIESELNFTEKLRIHSKSYNTSN